MSRLAGFLSLLRLMVTFKRTGRFPTPLHRHIFELPTELLLLILESLPDYDTLSSLILTHPTFQDLIVTHQDTITTSIANSLFGVANLPHIQTLLEISQNGAYIPHPPTLTPNRIPQLLALRKALDHAIPYYIAHSKRTIPWLQQNPAATAVPVFVMGEDYNSTILIERCFIRMYSVAMVLFHSPMDNNRARLRSLRGTRGVGNDVMFGRFFREIPGDEIVLVRSCLARLSPEESGLYMVLPPGTLGWRRRACSRNVKDVLMWDYDFGDEAGLLW